MKRLLAVLLILSVLSGFAVFPVSAEDSDFIINQKQSLFPSDTTVPGNLTITGDCPDLINLINVKIEGTLLVKADHPVTILFQGDSFCAKAELSGEVSLIGGDFGQIRTEGSCTVLDIEYAQLVESVRDSSLVSLSGSVEKLILSGKNSVVGGSGSANLVLVNKPGCSVNIRWKEMEKNTDEKPDEIPSSSVIAKFMINPIISPASSVVRAKVTFSNVPEDMAGDYRIYWYIGDTLSYYEWNFDLKDGSTSELTCSAHFNGEMDELPVWVKLVRNSDEEQLRFSTKVQVIGYSTAEYDNFQGSGHPYSIHLLRNQGVILVYGQDGKGEYTKLVNVFVCSVGDFKETSLGDYEIGLQMRWQAMMGDVYAQYCSQFNYNQLFHSVPYWSREPNNIEFDQYALLGSPASSGCVRLAAVDAKWIYDHCDSGTIVHNYDADELPVEKPIPAIIREQSINRGWDPTDPDSDNPTKASNPPIPARSALGKNNPVYRLCIK